MKRIVSPGRLWRAARRAARVDYWRQEMTAARVLKPAYFALLLRWSTWLLALLLVVSGVLLPDNTHHAPALLSFTGIWLLLQMLYVPVLRTGMGRKLLRRPWDNLAIWSAVEILLAAVIIHLSGGWGSPFYMYGLATVVIPALLFGYRVAFVAGVGFTVLYAIAVMANPIGYARATAPGVLDRYIAYLFVPTPFALFAAYLGSVLRQLEAERDNARRALAEVRTLQAVTASGLQLFADPERFVAQTVRRARRIARLRGMAIAYRLPRRATDGEAGDPAMAAERSAGFGPAQDLIAAYWRGETPPDDPHLLLLPLAQADRQLGALIAITPAVEQQRPFLTALAGQVSAALANAHLYAEAEGLAAQAERARLAREIHDGIAQSLFMLTLNLEACVELVDRDPELMRSRLQMLIEVARQTLWETRHYIHDLKPLLRDARGLRPAIENQIKEFATISGLSVEVRVSGEEADLPLTVRQALYRIVQEGLANVFKHAGARQVTVDLDFGGEGTRLTIADDGRGFTPPTDGDDARRGFGLGGMRERAEELGGRFELDSAPGRGTRLTIWAPNRQPTAAGRGSSSHP
jgi:signal transduction histidine kinase